MARTTARAADAVPATLDQLTAAVQAVPQQAADGDSAEFVSLPVERVEVGTIVAIHAQGKVRGVVVTKVGPRRATVEWTTPSTWAQDSERAYAESVAIAEHGDNYVAHRVALITDQTVGGTPEWRERRIASEREYAQGVADRVAERQRTGEPVRPRTYGKSVPLTSLYAVIA